MLSASVGVCLSPVETDNKMSAINMLLGSEIIIYRRRGRGEREDALQREAIARHDSGACPLAGRQILQETADTSKVGACNHMTI